MAFLIRNCQLPGRDELLDVRLRGQSIDQIGIALAARGDETIIEASGGALLPGLHDHHIHLASLAASKASAQCGPPKIHTQDQLIALLKQENQHSDQAWLRGIGYHPSVASDIDRHWLDQHIPDRPIRIQHRGGRLWILNTRALEQLGIVGTNQQADLPGGIEHDERGPSGRLYDCDQWLRQQLKGSFPSLAAASYCLASYGVTGITDTSPANGADEWNYFHESQAKGELLQKVRMMGSKDLPLDQDTPTLQAGEFKVHLLESDLPDIDSLLADIRDVRQHGRNVAIHCVSHTELVFATACLEAAGIHEGDRIEHASVTTPGMLDKVTQLGLRVVSQPHFIAERGDQYRKDVDTRDQPWLYRLRSLIDAGVPLAGGSDAPFGSANPWRSMHCAVNRTTASGHLLGPQEALTPEIALELYTGKSDCPGLSQRTISRGAIADLCLLSAPWEPVKQGLSTAEVRATWVDGEQVFFRD